MRTHSAPTTRSCAWLLAISAACHSSPTSPAASPAHGASGTSNDGGDAASAPSGGQAGDNARGGAASAPSGGQAGDNARGGASGVTENGAGGEGGANTSCDVKVTWSLSEQISTVASVEWTSDLDGIDSASIEFGLDTHYGMTANVDLSAPGHRTLLVGMKASHVYHFHVVARAGGSSCTSDDFTLATGPVPNGLPTLGVVDHGGTHAGGFLLSSFIDSGPAFMLDADGDYVWSYGTSGAGRAAISHDGKYVWYAAVNQAGGAAAMTRVTLDGLEAVDLTSEFADIHHDFTLLPDDTIGFLSHHGDADLVLEHAPDGSLRQVLDVGAVFDSTHTHANSLHYQPEDATYTLGELAYDSFVKFDRQGKVIWILGGDKSDFSGDTSWDGQHGHALLAPDDLLFFNNGLTSGVSSAWELKLDLTQHTATRVFHYQPGEHCLIYGDVARLDNADTLVTFSTLGVIHEVTPDGTLVRELDWSLGGALGYVSVLASPYPPFD